MVQVRSFRLSDYAPITNLFKDVLSDSCYDDTMEAFGRQLSWDSELVLVATGGNEIVGVIIGTIDKNRGYYYRIAVAHDHRRKGVGKQLIQAMRSRFELRKVSRVLITVDDHNEPILPFYESLGFRSTDFQRSAQELSIVCG